MKEYIDEIIELKKSLGDRVVIPAHHYQMDEIVDQADFIGDSYKLAVDCSRASAEFIVFAGVSFMAEGAAILAGPEQKVLIPDPSAGCPMARMITAEDAQKAMDLISSVNERSTIIPLVYMNSYTDMKAFCGANEGTVCTSSNAAKIVKRFLDDGKSVFFTPDYNLGANTATQLGIPKEEVVTVTRDYRLADSGGASAKLYLWEGYCHVHQNFTIGDIERLKSEDPGINIIVHPECEETVVNASDYSGSTSMIFNTIRDAAAGTSWGVGTELSFVERINKTFPDKRIVPLRESLCGDMAKITPEKLLASLRSINAFCRGKGPLVHETTVQKDLIEDAKKAMQRMIDIVEGN